MSVPDGSRAAIVCTDRFTADSRAAGAAVLMAFTAAAGAQEPFAAGRAGVAWRPLVPAAAGVDPAIVLLLLLSLCLSVSLLPSARPSFNGAWRAVKVIRLGL